MGNLATTLREWATALREWATTLRENISSVENERNNGPAIHVLACNGLNESEHIRKIINSLTTKLQTEYAECDEHNIDGFSYTKYTFPNNGRVPCDSKYDTGLIVILSKDHNTNSLEVVKRHVNNIRISVGIPNVIAVTTSSEYEEQSTTISMCPSIEIHRVLHSLLPGFEENKLDKKINVFLTGLNEHTLGKVKKALTTCIDERCISQIKISDLSNVDNKLSVLQEDSVAICCVHNSTRLIIISDTEEDEVGDIIKTAEGKCGEQRVMILLCGHKDLLSSSQKSSLYDEGELKGRFFEQQPRLADKADRQKLFLSMNWTINKTQKSRISQWIQECSKISQTRVKKIKEYEEGCAKTVYTSKEAWTPVNTEDTDTLL